MNKQVTKSAKGSVAKGNLQKVLEAKLAADADNADQKTARKAVKAATNAKPAKAAPKNPDTITTYKKANPRPADRTMMIVSAGGQQVLFDESRITDSLHKLLGVGKSFAAVQDYLAKHNKPAPSMARGLASREAPHSAKAVADQRGSGSATRAAKPAASAASSAKRSSQLDSALAIKLTPKGADKLKVGGSAGSIHNLTLLSKSATVGKAFANGLKTADINYAVKTGTITLG